MNDRMFMFAGDRRPVQCMSYDPALDTWTVLEPPAWCTDRVEGVKSVSAAVAGKG